MPRMHEDEEEQAGPSAGAAVPLETAKDHIAKLQNYVKFHLHNAKKRGLVRDNYRNGVVYEERKTVLEEVLKGESSRAWRNKCSRCQA